MIACPSAKWIVQALVPVTPLCLGLLLLSGCDQDKYSEDLTYPVRSDPLVVEAPTDPSALPPHFDLPGEFPQAWFVSLKAKGGKVVEPSTKLTPAEHQELENTLNKLFGTPAHPKVDSIGTEIRDALQLDDNTLAAGALLYRRHCLHCHGLSGDGRGHTAPWINPHPRDFRQGIFKFTSSSQSQGSQRKPRRDDLIRTLRQGVEGTAMPSFGLLSDKELNNLVSYVIHLSIRGEVEKYAIFDREKDAKIADAIKDALDDDAIPGYWHKADTLLIQPGQYPYTEADRQASISRGHQWFVSNCLGCHENYGRKDVYKYDVWGTVVRPANLTLGVFRGGRRPVDLYWRIYGGINGANMPAIFEALEGPQKDPKQGDLRTWDLVNFLEALPYKAMLPTEVRDKIYAPGRSGNPLVKGEDQASALDSLSSVLRPQPQE